MAVSLRRVNEGSDLMTTKHRVGNLVAVVFLGCGLMACTTQEAKSDGSAGRGGSGGSGGRATGGSGGGGGSTTAAACGTGPFAPTAGTPCMPPDQMLTNFTYDPDSGATDQTRFGVYGTTLSGGE